MLLAKRVNDSVYVITSFALSSEVRKRSHKGSKLNTWQESSMRQAVEEWRKQTKSSDDTKVSMRTLARAWNVPYETLRRRITGKIMGYASASGRPTILNELEEAGLIETIKNLAKVGFPLTRKDVQTLALANAKAHNYRRF